MKCLDLFCGIGSWTRALHDTGHEVVLAVDLDPNRHAVYRHHYPDVPCVLGDVFDIPLPAADAWFACADVPTLTALVSTRILPLKALVLETVREPIEHIVKMLRPHFGAGSVLTWFDAGGRRYIVARKNAPEWRSPPVGFEVRNYPMATSYPNLLEAEASLGLPPGYTGVGGADDSMRRRMLGAATYQDIARYITNQLKGAAP